MCSSDLVQAAVAFGQVGARLRVAEVHLIDDGQQRNLEQDGVPISDAGFLVIRFTPEAVCDGSWVVDRLRGELPRTMTEGAPVVALRTAAERRRAG